MLSRNLRIVFAILRFFQNQPSADLSLEIVILKIFYFIFYIHSFPIVYTRFLKVPWEAITQIIIVWYIIVMKHSIENLLFPLFSEVSETKMGLKGKYKDWKV